MGWRRRRRTGGGQGRWGLGRGGAFCQTIGGLSETCAKIACPPVFSTTILSFQIFFRLFWVSIPLPTRLLWWSPPPHPMPPPPTPLDSKHGTIFSPSPFSYSYSSALALAMAAAVTAAAAAAGGKGGATPTAWQFRGGGSIEANTTTGVCHILEAKGFYKKHISAGLTKSCF